MATVRLRNIEIPLTGNSRSFNRAARSAAQSARLLEQRQRILRREMRIASATAQGYVRSLVSLRGILALLAGSTGLGAIVTQSSQYAGVFLRTADGAKVLTETLLALRRVAGENFVSIELFDSSLLKLNQRISEAVAGQQNAIDGFRNLGVSIVDAEGNLRSADRILLDFIKGLSDAGQKAVARARFVFEETSPQIVPALVAAAKHGDNLANAYRRAIDPTREMFVESRKLGIQFNDLREDIKNVGVRISSDVSGPWQQLLQVMRDALPNAAKGITWLLENILIPGMRFLAENTLGAASAFLALAASMSKAGGILATVGGVVVSTFAASARSAAVLGGASKSARFFYGILGSGIGVAKGLTVAMLKLTAAVAVFAAKFVVFSVIFQLFTQPDVVIANLKRLAASFGALFSTIGTMIAQSFDTAIFYIKDKFLELAQDILRAFQNVGKAIRNLLTFGDKPGGAGVTRIGPAAQAQVAAARAAASDDGLFQSTIDDLQRLRDESQKAGAVTTDIVGDMKDVWKTFLDTVLGRDESGGIKAITNDLDVYSESARRAAQVRWDNRTTPIIRSADTVTFSDTARRRAQQRADVRNNLALANAGPQISPELLATRAAQARAVGMKHYTAEAQRAWKQMQDQMQRNQEMLNSMQSSFENFFQSLINGTAKASDAFKALAADIAKAVLQAMVIQPIASAITGGIQSFFNIPTPAGAAQGGNVNAGQPRLVGELGPEVFIPQSGGHIVPNRNIGRSVINNFSFNIESTDGPGVQRALDRAYPVFVQGALDAQQEAADRPGDLYE